MRKKYLMADLLVKISGVPDAYLEKNLKPYSCFSINNPDVIIRTTRSDGFIDNSFENVCKIGESQYFHEGDSCDSLIFYDEKLCRIVAIIQFCKTYRNVAITVCNLEKLFGINSDKLMFNVVGIAMHYVLRMNGGFVLHSSAIAAEGHGIAFSAPSGVGKSTHTSLWLEHMPGTVIINDDTPMIRIKNNDVYLYGSPWAGTSGINANASVPLDAVVFLEQSENNSISEIPSSEAIKLFVDGIVPSVTHKMYLKTLDTLDAVMKHTKMYSLKCNQSVDAMLTVKNIILK